ncbi:BON domain-containing protein [Paraburkholderia tropica]|uniref:BON domain-containing protein n=1 Tax=Paraburkholderia tropica TaxID=92647 RepID=UPI003D2B41A5
MKKAFASVIYTTSLAFGLTAHAADAGGEYPAVRQVSQAKFLTHSAKSERVANLALAKKVRSAMMKQKNVDMTKVTVIARGGIVTLLGSVPDDTQVQLAQNDAVVVNGVSSVKNNLLVQQGGN